MPYAIPLLRNLLLVAQPAQLDTNDLVVIRDRIHAAAADVRAVVVGHDDDPLLLETAFWSRPTLTVSFGPLGRFQPLRGPVLQNRSIAKLEQFQRMRAAGVATPLTAPLAPELVFEDADWGPLVIVKPARLSRTSSGEGLRLFRTVRLAGLLAAGMPSSHPLRREPHLVQSFIASGPRFRVYRSLVLFGAELYQSVAEADEAHPPLDSADDETIEALLPEPPRSRTAVRMSREADVTSFAAEVAAAFPDTPLLGCDILREEGTHRLFAIEVNAGGNVWHLSSPRAAPWRRIDSTVRYLREFGSYDVAARVLAAVTRRRAA